MLRQLTVYVQSFLLLTVWYKKQLKSLEHLVYTEIKMYRASNKYWRLCMLIAVIDEGICKEKLGEIFCFNKI